MNLLLKDGSVIINILLIEIGARYIRYKVHDGDNETFQILRRDVDFASKISLEPDIT